MWCHAEEPGINMRTNTNASGTESSKPSTTDRLSQPGATAIRLRFKNFNEICLLPVDTVKNFYRFGVEFTEVPKIQRVALKFTP